MKSLKPALIAIITSILVTVSSCSSPTATPTGTVSAYLDALVARNAQALVSYEAESYWPGTSAERIEQFETFFEQIKSYSITNRHVAIESEDETTAAVSATFDFSVTDIDDITTDDSVVTVFDLTKVGGKWLLSGSSDNEIEARRTEKGNIETAVIVLMVENELSSIPNPVDTIPTNDMTAFPDSTSTTSDKLNDPDGTAYTYPGDQVGYVLYEHDKTADAGTGLLHNYVTVPSSTYFYTIDADGTVHQWADAAKTGGEYTD